MILSGKILVIVLLVKAQKPHASLEVGGLLAFSFLLAFSWMLV